MHSEPIDPQQLIATLNVSGLCRTAEDYFKAVNDHTFSMSKPFCSVTETPHYLYQLGLLLDGLKLHAGLTVLEFGAGVCWLSRLLNQLGLSTISVDPSITALNVGRELFAKHPLITTCPPLDPPAFLEFNGHSIDLPDASVDRIVCFDSFHHVPNQQEVLAEFARVLRPGGIAGFSEPGRFHSQTVASQREMRLFNVLENDILVEEIAATAKSVGFTKVYCKLQLPVSHEVDVDAFLGSFTACNPQHMQALLDYNRAATIFFLQKGELRQDSRSAVGLAHALRLLAPAPDRVHRLQVQTRLPLAVHCHNTGTATWLATARRAFGKVALGVGLLDQHKHPVQPNFFRCPLPHDMAPGEEATLRFELPALPRGEYVLSFDMVAERVSWFENLGASPVFLRVVVE
ncbi:MAG: class I SAM-dependent methyltransferase [Desulfovibrio sp.]|nr:class I SAM-dependent methyltransferase [Desulfovibrio sp.]MCA1986266.1 class I SAM-dependent methyltransferase [Desulfovibrio sp.]